MSGLLMDVIGTLSSSHSNEQRDLEKAKLEREFKLSDKRLEQLVAGHHANLAEVMQTFSTASARLNEARSRITSVRGQLAACRSLLHCRRDELKKLWLEGVEQKEILHLLDQVEEIKDLPEQVSHLISHKKYLKAAQLLQTARMRLQGPLATIEGLKEVKSDLEAKQTKLYELLMEDLVHNIYVKPCTEVLQWKRLQVSQTPFQRSSGRGSSQNHASGSQRAKNEFLKASPVTLEIVTNGQTNQNGEDLASYVSNIVQCLVLLEKLSETSESLKSNMAKELGTVVGKTVQQVSEMYPTTPAGSLPLQYLVTALIEQMKRVVQTHSMFLDCVKSNREARDVSLYTKEDVWSQIQTVMQVLLSQYLDVGHASSSSSSGGSFSSNSQIDLNTQFSKRRPNRTQKSALFRFEGSLQSMSLSSYLRETAGSGETQYCAEDGTHKGPLVQPSVRHIIAVYQPLLEFVQDIEKDTDCPPGTRCALHSFVTDFTRDVFLGQIHVELATSLEEATRKLDAWKALNSPEALKNLKSSRPLLQSTVQVHQCVTELRQLMQSLPQFFDHFLGMACNNLLNFCETCQAAYRGLVQPESEDKRVISATWAKDEDINRFLRSLGSWTALQSVRQGNVTPGESYEESPEEINQRSAKETEILTGNLGDAVIPPHEILGDPMQLRILALLQESLEWFTGTIQEFAHSITRSSTTESLPAVPESNVQTLHQIARDFENLADTCLLVLHLEVRMHCFYHLVPLGLHAQFWLAGDNQDPDPEIVRLSRDLTAIDEALSAYLQPRKLKYVFEGVSHLVASILISSVQHIKRINENGVKKMCRNIFNVQQTLTSITLAREPALDHARQYFELLCLTPEEILNGIMERGAQYTELEYVQILQLVNRSRPGPSPTDVTRHLERLSEILGELGVTV